MLSATRWLVDSKLATLAMHSDGRTVWRHEGRIREGVTKLTMAPDMASCRITMQPSPGGEYGPDGFALEAWAQAGQFRYCQMRVFGDREFPPAFTRAYLGEFTLYSGDESSCAHLYPILVVFDSGVVLLEFRLISPGKNIALGEFVDRFVNMFQIPFDKADVSPSLASLGIESHYRAAKRLPIHLRLALLWLQKRHDRAISSQTTVSDSEGFSFARAPLSRSGDKETLADLALTTLATVAYVLGRPPGPIGYLLRGHQGPFKLGNYWSGRPHIHITRFRGQRRQASDNDQSFAAEITQILNRQVETPRSKAPSWPTTNNLRTFDDYSVFVGSHMTLWMWSLNGLRRQESWADPNRGHLIYEHQATAEVLEYGHLLNRALFDRAAYGQSQSFEELWLKLVQTQQILAEATHFGEIRELWMCGRPDQ